MIACAADANAVCEFAPRGRFIDRSGLVGKVGIEQCTRCGLARSTPSLPDVDFLYADRSSQDFQPGTRGFAAWIKRFAFRRQADRLLAQAGPATGTIVDYGCGSGLFTRCLAERVPSGVLVIGTDFHEAPPPDFGPVTYVPRARRATLRGSAAMVVAMHVLEHDDDPQKLLADMFALAAPGAIVVIEVPNVDCAWARLLGRYWDAWYLPYHRLHFSRASLRALIERGGARVERESGESVPTMGRSVANLLGRHNGPGFILLGALLHPLQWVVERLTDQPSALRIVARLPD